MNRKKDMYYYFTTITGHAASVITPEATLPNNSFLNCDLPLVPVTIKSTFLFFAYSTIADTIDVAVTITSVCNWILLLLTSLYIFSSILLNHCCASFLASSKRSFTISGVVKPLIRCTFFYATYITILVVAVVAII